jgi:hypothetical protein
MGLSQVKSGENSKKNISVKLQKISEIQPSLPFSEFDFIEKYRVSFRQSELGRIMQVLPLKELAESITKKMPKRNPQGKKRMFSLEGEIALMFLKSYTGMSDDCLVEMLNGNFHMQMFCGILIDPNRPIRDGKIVSAVRNRLAHYLDIRELQKVLFNNWKGDMSNIDTCFSDATCYESHLRYPTDIKLLWEACEWLHNLIKKTCHDLGERQPRNKFNDIRKARLTYAKQRKHTKLSTQKMQRRLLSLLQKLREQWDRIRAQFNQDIILTNEQESRLIAIKDVYHQQKDLFEHKEVKHRIVSIDRPYLRPIVRGKENKRVEFGAKVNNIQIDGISFIEHHSFEAFNEGVRVKQCIEYHKELTGMEVKQFGGDSIYANNASRKYCTEHNITTCFARKGPKPKDEDESVSTKRRILGNLRATVMEGSFGNQKQHYGVGRIAARNQFSEKLLLFFGIHMANAATLAERRRISEAKKQETQLEQRRA